MKDVIKTIIIPMMIVSTGIIISIIMFGCGIDRIDDPNAPRCCQTLYNMKWLDQKKKDTTRYTELEACCRIQDKIVFCEDRYQKKEEIENCLSRQKHL